MSTRNISLTTEQDTSVREMIKAGVEALERGEFIEIDDAGLQAYLDELAEDRTTLLPQR